MKYCVSGLVCRQLVRIRVMDLHSKTCCTLRYRQANTPHPENPEDLAGHLPAEKGLGAWDRPLAASDQILSFKCSPTRPKKQEHSDIRGRIGHFSGRVPYRDIVFYGRGHIDMVNTYRIGGDHFDGWRQSI